MKDYDYCGLMIGDEVEIGVADDGDTVGAHPSQRRRIANWVLIGKVTKFLGSDAKNPNCVLVDGAVAAVARGEIKTIHAITEKTAWVPEALRKRVAQ